MNNGCFFRDIAPLLPEERRRIKKNYSTVFTEMIIHSAGSYITAQVFFVCMMLTGYKFGETDDGTVILDAAYTIAGTLPSILFCLGIFIFDKVSSGNRLSAYFRTEDISFGGTVAFFGMIMLSYGAAVILQRILLLGCFSMHFSPIKEEYLTEEDLTPAYLAVQIIFTVILAPIAEELMFRGVVLRRLCAVSGRFGIFASALIFGLMHGNALQAVTGFTVGLVLGYAAVKTGSLLLPAAGHIFINAFAVSSSFAEYLMDKDAAELYWVTGIIIFLVLGVITLIIMLAGKKIHFPGYSEYHSKRTFPVMVCCVSFWIIGAYYIYSIISKFGPVTDKLIG